MWHLDLEARSVVRVLNCAVSAHEVAEKVQYAVKVTVVDLEPRCISVRVGASVSVRLLKQFCHLDYDVHNVQSNAGRHFRISIRRWYLHNECPIKVMTHAVVRGMLTILLINRSGWLPGAKGLGVPPLAGADAFAIIKCAFGCHYGESVAKDYNVAMRSHLGHGGDQLCVHIRIRALLGCDGRVS